MHDKNEVSISYEIVIAKVTSIIMSHIIDTVNKEIWLV